MTIGIGEVADEDVVALSNLGVGASEGKTTTGTENFIIVVICGDDRPTLGAAGIVAPELDISMVVTPGARDIEATASIGIIKSIVAIVIIIRNSEVLRAVVSAGDFTIMPEERIEAVAG